MISRRELIASGLTISLLAREAAAAVDAGPTESTGAPGMRFVADEHFAEARAAAQAAMAGGAAVLPLGDDVTPVYEALDLALRQAPLVIGGLATPHALFVIERLAWDRGLRTIYRGRHRPRRAHVLEGVPALTERIDGARTGDWAESLGMVLAAWRTMAAGRRDLLTSPTLTRPDAGLVSWLLMPKAFLETGT